MVFTQIIASFKAPRILNNGAAWASFIRRNGIYVTSFGVTGQAPELSSQALGRLEKIISR